MQRNHIAAAAAAKVEVDRRTFIKTVALAGGAAVLTGVPLVSSVVTPSLHADASRWVDLGRAADLAPDDFTMLSFEFTVKDGWLVLPRRGFVWARPEPQGHVRVFSSTCTHLACNVVWRRQANCFECPCHSGRFDALGNPVSGPPKKPLHVLPHKVEDGNLLVHVTA
jgi:Rieske Fe-S protein